MLLAWLLLSACDFANAPITDGKPVDTTTSSCPTGLSEADSLDVTFSDLRLDAISFDAVFDPAQDWHGQPAACVNSTGTEVQLVIAGGEGAEGLLTVNAPDVGDYDLFDSASGGKVRIVLDGDATGGETLTVSTWLDGLLSVTATDDTFSFLIIDASGNAADGTDVLVNGFGDVDQP